MRCSATVMLAAIMSSAARSTRMPFATSSIVVMSETIRRAQCAITVPCTLSVDPRGERSTNGTPSCRSSLPQGSGGMWLGVIKASGGRAKTPAVMDGQKQLQCRNIRPVMHHRLSISAMSCSYDLGMS